MCWFEPTACNVVIIADHSTRRLIQISSGILVQLNWMLTACLLVHPREVPEVQEGSVHGEGGARVRKQADGSPQTCRTDLHSWNRASLVLHNLMMAEAAGEGLVDRIVSKKEGMVAEIAEEGVEKMTEQRLFKLSEILEETDHRALWVPTPQLAEKTVLRGVQVWWFRRKLRFQVSLVNQV